MCAASRTSLIYLPGCNVISPHLKYYSINHDILDFIFKNVCLFQYDRSKRLPNASQQVEESVKCVHS